MIATSCPGCGAPLGGHGRYCVYCGRGLKPLAPVRRLDPMSAVVASKDSVDAFAASFSAHMHETLRRGDLVAIGPDGVVAAGNPFDIMGQVQ